MDVWMWVQLMWLQFEVVRGPVGGAKGAQTGPKSTQNDPDRTSDNLKLQPHELQPHQRSPSLQIEGDGGHAMISARKNMARWTFRKSASEPDIGLPGLISAGFYSGKPQNSTLRPKTGRSADDEASRLESGRNPAWKPDFRPGNTIA